MNWYKVSQLDHDKEQAIQEAQRAAIEVHEKGLAPDFVEHMRKNYTIERIRSYTQEMLQDKSKIQQRRGLEQARMQRDKQRQDNALFGEYFVCEGFAERIICSPVNPECEKKGMEAYNMAPEFPELKGYYGIHVGSADEWLPILARDGYCNGDAYVYQIDLDSSPETFYEVDDAHVLVKGENPDSRIIFSKQKLIPSNMIEIVKRVPARRIEPAKFPHEF